MTTYEKQQLPTANEDGRFGPVTVKVGNVSKFWKPGERPFMGLDLVGLNGNDWWMFRPEHASQAVTGATLTVMLKCNRKKEGDGYYQDVDEILDAAHPGDSSVHDSASTMTETYADRRDDPTTVQPLPDYGFAMDGKDLSIREQAMFNHVIETALEHWRTDDPAKFDAIIAATWQTGLRMMAPSVRERVLAQYAQATQPE